MISQGEQQQALAVARKAAVDVAAVLKQGLCDQQLSVEHKGEVDLVTEYDRRAEAIIVEQIRDAFPSHTIVAEEGSPKPDQRRGPVWLVDPLDGTTNFSHHHPWYCISIALEVDGEAEVGVVHAPTLGWEFWAARGQGAWLGKTPIHVSKTNCLDQALVATGFPYDRRTSKENNVPQLGRVIRKCQGIRRMGSAALDCALVAWGRLDAYWEFKLQAWDVAAGALLIQEAGGKVTSPRQKPFFSSAGEILASNGSAVHAELAAALL